MPCRFSVKKRFFSRASSCLLAASAALVFCLAWANGWQVSAQAGDLGTVPDTSSVNSSSINRRLPAEIVYPRLRVAEDKAKSYYNAGTAYYKKGNFPAAIKYLSLSISLESGAADSYFNRGLSYRRLHRIPESISDFSRAIRLQPGQPGYYFERSNARIIQNDFEGAIADASKAIQLSPEEPESYFLRGLANLLKGNAKDAATDAARALHIAPDYVDAKRLLLEALNTAFPR